MHANELVLAMIQEIASHPQIEIEDADGIDLLDLIVGVAQVNMLRDGLGDTVEDTLQIIELARVLNLYDDDLPPPLSPC